MATTGPLDLSKYIEGATNQAYKNWGTQGEQLGMARDAYGKTSGIVDKTTGRALDTGADFLGYAKGDRDLYQRSTVPGIEQQMDFAREYTTPGRMAANRGAAMGGVGMTFDAAADAAKRSLQGYGVNPAAGRYAGLDAGLAAARATAQAGAGTKSDRDTEALGQQYLSNAINTGMRLPGQATQAGALGLEAGNAAVNANLANTAGYFANSGTAPQWNALGNDMFKQWSNAAQAETSAGLEGRKVDLAAEKQKSEESSGIGAMIGTGAGMLLGAFGGPMGSSIGSSIGGKLGGMLGTMAAEGGMIPGEDETFDPEGEDYDYETARAAGIEPDAEGHWSSRDPRTGMMLKGRRHPTFDKGVDQDRRMGYGLEMQDGRYYTQPFAEGGQVFDEDLTSGVSENFVDPSMSPSGGEETDDVHAMVNAGEFVMPKDVTSWYGEKYMQGLIDKARKEMAGPKAEPTQVPIPQAMAIEPPAFQSEGARR